MGILAWLFGSERSKSPTSIVGARSPATTVANRNEIPPGFFAELEGPGCFGVEVVDESKYIPAFEEICGPRTDESVNIIVQATLVHEDHNPYDAMAIRIDVAGQTVGYLRRDVARDYRARLQDAGFAGTNARCNAVVGGTVVSETKVFTASGLTFRPNEHLVLAAWIFVAAKYRLIAGRSFRGTQLLVRLLCAWCRAAYP